MESDRVVAPPRIRNTTRRRVAQRTNGCCEYCLCQEAFCPDPFSVEHIVPVSRGGDSKIANLAYSCQGCNNRKYTSVEATDPVTRELAPLYHPRSEEHTSEL